MPNKTNSLDPILKPLDPDQVYLPDGSSIRMALHSWELLRQKKDELKISNREIAEITGIPKGTIDRYLSGFATDPGLLNCCRMAVALGIPLHDYIYGLFPDLKPEEKKTDCCPYCSDERYTGKIEDLERIIALYERSLKFKNKLIGILLGLLAFVVLFVLIVLVIDITNPEIGWFQRMFSSIVTRSGGLL